MSVALVVALCGPVLSACAASRDAASDVGGASAALVSDTARGSGLPGFFFLPPIAEKVRFTGSFVGGLSPMVTVEEVGGRGTIATFTRGGDEDHRILEEDGRYEAKWHVEHSGVKDGSVYRIHVSVNGVELGFAEAKGAHGDARKDARRQGYVPVDGGELVIAFRIEKEALGTFAGTIGVDGGRVCAANGACVEIPPGALDTPTAIRIEQTPGPLPADALTPVYRLTPEGTVFARPVRLSLPVPAGVTVPTIYWTALGSSTSFDPLGTTLSGGVAVAENVHFSLAYVGAPSPTRTVVGSRVITYVSATTRVSDFTAPAIGVEALVDDGAGGLRAIPGTFLTDAAGAPTGVFVIPGVPTGRYTLHVAGQYLVTDSSAPDLGYTVPGRFSPPLSAPPLPTSFLDVSLGLGSPWQAGDSLELIGSENNMWDFWTDRFTTLVPGDASTQFRIGLRWFNGSLPHRFEQPLAPCAPGVPVGTWCGDRLHVAHLSSTTSSNGTVYQRMSEMAEFSPFSTDLVPGSAVPITAALEPVAITRTVEVDFRGSEFRAALQADGNPAQLNSDPENRFFGVFGQPGLAADGFYSSNADMLLVLDDAGTDFVTGPMTYGSPDAFGGSWGEIASARWMSPVVVQLPGTTPAPLNGLATSGFAWTDTVANMVVPAVIRPQFTLPRNITVTGPGGSIPFFAGGAGIGLGPTITWSPPRNGVPQGYSVSVVAVRNVSGATRLSQVGLVVTPDTSVTLPPGILVAGQTYLFRVSGWKSGNPLAPFRAGLGDFSAWVVSGVFTP